MWIAHNDIQGAPGRKSIAPGVYFRMHLIGYFEGIESERGLEWRCADSLSLRIFLGLELTQRVPITRRCHGCERACHWKFTNWHSC